MTLDVVSTIMSTTLGAVAYRNGNDVPYMTRLRAGSLVVHVMVAEVGVVATVSPDKIGARRISYIGHAVYYVKN